MTQISVPVPSCSWPKRWYGIDGMEVSWRSSDNFDQNSIPSIDGISIAGGFLSNEYLWLAGGFALILIAGGIEYFGSKKTGIPSDDFF